MPRLILLCLTTLLLGLCFCGCSGSGRGPQDEAGDDPQALDAWRTAQLAELRAMQTPAGVDPALWRVLRARFEEFILASPEKTALAAPTGPASAPLLSLDEETLELLWGHSMQGDYSQDSEVGISDLTPLGQHFNTSSPLGGPFPFNSVQAVVDGDGNGQINISDISPIGANFGRRTSAYNVYRSADFSDVPQSAADDNGPGAELLGTVDFSAATGSPGAERLRFSFALEDSLPGWFYWVRPADAGSEGTPSNVVSLGGGDDNANPEAVLSASPLAGSAPLSVGFDASASFDFDGANQDITDIVQFNWDFDGDGAFDLATFGPTVSHIYTAPGQFSARVQAVDAQAGVGEDSVAISVAQPGNLPPVAAFSADPVSGTAPLIVDFDDSATTDDGGVENLLYEWDFNGDGFAELSTDHTAVVQHFYQGGGDFLVELTVTDQGGLSDSHQVALNVEGDPVNEAPIAILEASVTGGPVPLDVSFDFSASFDPDGQIVLYELSFDGDSDFEVILEADPVVFEHTYETGGLFRPLLRVTDNLGLSATTRVDILADDGSNSPPNASFSFFPNGGQVPLEITFDASSSSDTDGSIVLYEWDFEGDGDFSFQTTEAVVQHTYTTGGERQPGLRVTDNEGAVDDLLNSQNISVDNPNNQPPVASFSVTELSADFPQEYEFDGSASSDPDGEVVQYQWDFDGDGFVDRFSNDPVATFKYFPVGSYVPALTVRDNEDQLGSTGGEPIEVSQGWQEVEVDGDLGVFPGSLSLATIKTKDATDLFLAYISSQNEEMRIARAALDNPATWTLPASQPAPADDPALHLSLLSVEQAPGIFYMVNPAAGADKLRFVRALDFAVTGWNEPLTVRESPELNSGSTLTSRLFSGKPAVIVAEGANGLKFFRSDDSLASQWTSEGVVLNPDTNSFLLGAVGVGNISAASLQGGQISFYKATQNDGSVWSSPVPVTTAASNRLNINRLGLGLVGGLPAIGYVDDADNLAFIRAEDAAGSVWSAPEIAFPAEEAPNSARNNVTIGVRSGLPALLCVFADELLYVEALDANATAWGEGERVALGGNSPEFPSAVISASGIVIAYTARFGGDRKLMVTFRD